MMKTLRDGVVLPDMTQPYSTWVEGPCQQWCGSTTVHGVCQICHAYTMCPSAFKPNSVDHPLAIFACQECILEALQHTTIETNPYGYP